jgi:predicted HicB family RNase H-like nuclease
MSRKKINFEQKKKNFGITIHPELSKILSEMAEKENKTISNIIEEVLTEHIKNKNSNNE